jgi:4-amino-4-deoxy-L-arabinose transferase-like glycosyltransferase
MLSSTSETAEIDVAPPARSALWRRASRDREITAPWERLSLVALLGITALLYLWNLSASGWANAFYSAAVEAGTKSWSAFFFGSFDASNFITVDKPPAALWVMDLSARIFGVSSWSILAPEALEGVAAVGLLYATVRRWFSPSAALLAGLVMALTPVAALMFRFNNPDALLVLLLVASAYALTRALEHGDTRWLLLAGSLIGFGFLTKMLQAFLVVPPFAFVYLVAAPVSLRRRLWQLIAGGAALLISAGWWVMAMVLIPASSRPYVGGSQNNSILNLIFGYNGFGRLTGDETGSVGGAPRTGGGRWGPTGLLRLFGSEMGGQVSWLLPAALVAFGALLWLTWRAPRTDRTRAATLLWGGWLLVSGVVFSYAEGIIHPYYTVALSPAIGALVGIGGVALWQHRSNWIARVLLAIGVAGTAAWAFVLLDRSPSIAHRRPRGWRRLRARAASRLQNPASGVARRRRGGAHRMLEWIGGVRGTDVDDCTHRRDPIRWSGSVRSGRPRLPWRLRSTGQRQCLRRLPWCSQRHEFGERSDRWLRQPRQRTNCPTSGRFPGRRHVEGIREPRWLWREWRIGRTTQ